MARFARPRRKRRRVVTMAIYDAEQGLFAENMALGRRLQRLSPVLAGMASDLAASRREAAALRRENDKLRAGSAWIGDRRSSPARDPAAAAGSARMQAAAENPALCISCGQPVAHPGSGSSEAARPD
jgi:hypothetical protein